MSATSTRATLLVRGLALLIVASTALLIGGCGGGGEAGVKSIPADAQQEQLLDAARGAFDSAEYEQADRLYRLALERAYLRDDDQVIAAAAYNLAVVHLRRGDLAGAEAALVEARAALAGSADAAQLDVLLLDAEVRFRRGDAAAAEQLVARGREVAVAAPLVSAQFVLLSGQLACGRGDDAAARADLAAAVAAAELPAYARLAGCIARLAGDDAAAAAAFDREAESQRRMRNYWAMADALARAGAAYARGGDGHAAADRLLRAGRSAAKQGQIAQAEEWLEGAQAAADESGDLNSRTAAATALTDLQRRAQAHPP